MGEEYDATTDTTQLKALQNLENLLTADDAHIPAVREEEDNE